MKSLLSVLANRASHKLPATRSLAPASLGGLSLLAAIALSLSSCGLPAGEGKIANGPDAATESISPSPGEVATSQAFNTTPNDLAENSKTAQVQTPVTLYTIDNQCEELVPELIQVPATQELEAAVGEAIERNNSADFSLAGYRISVDSGTGVATIDLRVAANSSRTFNSLSSCEQLALFGSLRKTLTANSAWNIKDVQFTEKGQELYL